MCPANARIPGSWGGVLSRPLALLWLVGLGAACSTEFSLSKAAGEPCRRCSRSSCLAALGECQAGTACPEREECVTQCRIGGASAGECDERCFPTLEGAWLIDPLSSCQAERCADSCGRSCGGFVFPRAGCGECVERGCCEAASACAADPLCRAVTTCRNRCKIGDWVCIEGCKAEPGLAAAVEIADRFAGCLASKCARDCAYGESWGCVGDPRLPSPDEPTVTLRARLVDVGLAPIPGVSARACTWLDADCQDVLAAGVTDSSGTFALRVEGRTSIPLRVDLHHPLFADAVMTFPVPMNTTPSITHWFILPRIEELPVLAQATGMSSNASLGHAQLVLLDCTLTPAPNLVLTAESDTAVVFYARNNFPDRMALATDRTGLSVLVNLAPGLPKVRAYLSDDPSRPVLEGQVLVRPGMLSLGVLWPN